MAAIASPPIVVIGLDVGDGGCIRRWIQKGHLPVLGSLLTHGVWGDLETPAEALHISAWPSLYTGTMPGAHGIYYPFQPRPGSQGACRIGPGSYGQPPLWQLLDAAGWQCLIFDAPYAFPIAGFRGSQIFEWGTWAWYWRPMSTPSTLFRELIKHCGAYPMGFEANQIGFSPLDLEDLRARLVKGAALKAKAVRWLMSRLPWDFFFVVFGETHPGAHYLWSHGDFSVTANDEALRDVYAAIDHAVGEILEGVGENVTVCLISGDGVGPNYAGWHLLPEVLRKVGYTVAPDSMEHTAQRDRRGRKDLLKPVRDVIPLSFRQGLSRRLPARWRDAMMTRWASSDIDWGRTRAFCLPTDLEGCIRINVKGREPHGIVSPGAEYTKVCEELVQHLQALINPRTQRPAVRRVVRATEIWTGGRRDWLPDLVVVWSGEAEIEALSSPAIGTVAGRSPDIRPGTHRPPGLVMVRGPQVPVGRILQGGHVVDFAPTLLAAFGLPPAEQMHGRAWRF